MHQVILLNVHHVLISFICCLFDANIIDVQIAHNNKTKSPANYAKAIFKIDNFTFKFNLCITLPIIINEPDTNLPILTNINDKLDDIKKLILSTVSESINYNNHFKISYADSLKKMTDLSSQFNTSIHTRKNSININSVGNNDTLLMVVIENIAQNNNMDTLKLNCNVLKLNINSILNAKFKNRSAILTLNSLFSRDQLLFSTSLLRNSIYNYLFIHPMLASDDIYFKKMSYHTIKKI